MFVKFQYLFLILILVKFNCGGKTEIIDSLEICKESTEIDDDNNSSSYYHNTATRIKFYLINPQNESIELNSTNLNLVDSTNPIKFIIHGGESTEKHLWIDKIAHVYHTKGNYNVIAVDWSIDAIKDTNYIVEAIDSVGNILGIFILQITNMDEYILSETHLIGSSIGAQIGGVAGEIVSKKGKKVGRITGLDPTVPESVDKLDENDADFVDVIHTGVYIGNRKCGVVDFYIVDKDGTPICFNSNNTINDTCGKLLANDYYIKTIEDKFRFEGISCYNSSAKVAEMCDKANSAIMGEYVSKNISGSYLVSKDVATGIYNHSNYLLILSIAMSLYFLFR